MGCPACETDYDKLEQEIAEGRLHDREELARRLKQSEMFVRGNTLIYCPDCMEKISRLMDRVSSRLRKQTLAGIHDLLDRAHEERKAGR